MAIKGSSSVTLVDLSDAYSVTLTSEAYTFQGNTTGAPAGLNCTTEIVSYCGNALRKSSITASNITCPTGISATVSNNNTVSPTVTFKTTATLTGSCEAIIPIKVDDVTINKKFSFAVAKTGATGATGAAGASIFTLITNYSYTQSYIDTYSKDGYSGTWTVASTSGVKVGDTVLLRLTNTTKNGYVFIIAKVITVVSATAVRTTSIGLIDKGDATNYWKHEGVLDLRASTYDVNKWYPFLANSGLNAGFTEHIRVWYTLEGTAVPSWSKHRDGYTVNFEIDMNGSGWGIADYIDISKVVHDSYQFCDVSPVSCTQCSYSSYPILWLRGGGCYHWQSSGTQTAWRGYTAKTNIYNSEYPWYVEPVSSRPTPEGMNYQSEILKNRNSITLKVSKNDVLNQLNSELKITGNSIDLTTGHFTVDSTNLQITSDGTLTAKNGVFSGKLEAATGTFAGNIRASKAMVGGTSDNTDLYYGLKTSQDETYIVGYGREAGQVIATDSIAGLYTGYQGAASCVVCDNNGNVDIGGSHINLDDVCYIGDTKLEAQKRSDSGYFHKDGYVCHLHCWTVPATTLITTVPERYRPKNHSVTLSGWCRNTGSNTYYPCIAMLNTSGQWQVYAMTSFGGAPYVIYEGSIDRRPAFYMLLSGSWVTSSNG